MKKCKYCTHAWRLKDQVICDKDNNQFPKNILACEHYEPYGKLKYFRDWVHYKIWQHKEKIKENKNYNCCLMCKHHKRCDNPNHEYICTKTNEFRDLASSCNCGMYKYRNSTWYLFKAKIRINMNGIKNRIVGV